MSIHLFSPSPLSIPHPLFSPPSLFPKQPLTPPLNTSKNNPLSSTPKPLGRPKAKINKNNPTTPPKPNPPKGSPQNPISQSGSGSESQIEEDFPYTHGRPKGKKKEKTLTTQPKPNPPKGSPQNPNAPNGSGSESEIVEDFSYTRGGPKGKKKKKEKEKNLTTPPNPNPPKGSPQNPDPQSGSGSESETDEDFPYMDPPLVCCFGSVKREFIPSVRVAEHGMDPDVYSEWKMLQWKPPEFARAPGGSAGNVAISHVRLGGRAEFMGKVGRDEFGEEMVCMMNSEGVQTRSVKFDDVAKTGCCYMRVKFGGRDGKNGMGMEVVRDAAEDCLLPCELNLDVLKEARIFHFNSEVLISPSMRPTLFAAITLSKKYGGLIFFDLNLPLPLWKNRDETRAIIKQAWEESDIIEVSREELEFLLDEDYYHNKRNYRSQYYADNYEDTKKNMSEYYHYTPEEVSPLWHDKLKILLVTDGTLRIHYYTPSFDGVVVGTEDVLITPFTCDRTGSGDAVVAAIMRKLTTCDEMYGDRDVLERQLRFAVAAGIISQWTIGAVRGFPTESAAQNLKEQVYVPSMW